MSERSLLETMYYGTVTAPAFLSSYVYFLPKEAVFKVVRVFTEASTILAYFVISVDTVHNQGWAYKAFANELTLVDGRTRAYALPVDE